jgi:hypothetical protein
VRLCCRLEVEATQQTAADLLGLVEDLVAPDADGRDQWNSLEASEKAALDDIFTHHSHDLTSTVRKVPLTLWRWLLRCPFSCYWNRSWKCCWKHAGSVACRLELC